MKIRKNSFKSCLKDGCAAAEYNEAMCLRCGFNTAEDARRRVALKQRGLSASFPHHLILRRKEDNHG